MYAVDGVGDPIAWHGFRNDYPGNDAPYLTCRLHTHDAWLEQGPGMEEEEETNPDDTFPSHDDSVG